MELAEMKLDGRDSCRTWILKINQNEREETNGTRGCFPLLVISHTPDWISAAFHSSMDMNVLILHGQDAVPATLASRALVGTSLCYENFT